jgi:hypothetical protein
MTRQPVSAALRPSSGLLAALLAGLLCAGAADRACAGQLDKGLLRQGGEVLFWLNDRKCQNVGVLPFLVQKGSGNASFEDAPVALNLTTRLENALIVSQDPRGKTIGIIRNAAGTASRSRVGAYRTSPAAFKKLFAQEYNLAWGNQTVKANVFLTGRVVNNGKDGSRTSVVIEAFDSSSMKSGKLVKAKVCEFTLPTDRALLSDLGYAWALSATVLRRTYSNRDRDRLATQQVSRRDEDNGTPRAGQSRAPTPGNIAGFSFEVRYNNRKQAITPLRQAQQGNKAPLWTVPVPPPDAEIALVLTRTDRSERTLGVVLKVNGQSTWRKEDRENVRCRKWLFEPSTRGKPEWYLGFYLDTTGKNLLKFRSLPAQESEAGERVGRVGWIDVEVFASAEPGTEDESEMQVSTRSVRLGKSLREVQAAIRKANNVRLMPVKLPRKPGTQTSRDLIDAEVTPIEGPEIGKGELPNPQPLGSLSIRYWEPGRRR